MAAETTLGIALGGLVMAAATAGWNVYRDGFRDRACLKLSLSRGSFAKWAGVPPEPTLPSPDTPLVFVRAVNVGRRPITITSGGGVEFPDGSWGMFTAPLHALPKKLGEGDKVEFFNPEESFRRLVQEHGIPTHIRITDASDKVHRKRVPRDLRPWLQNLAKKGTRLG
jgi:hypothetical protein